MATLQTLVSDPTPTSGDEVTVTLTAFDLAPAVEASTNVVTATGSALLSDGTVVSGEDVTLTVTRPAVAAQEVVSYGLDIVSGNATFTQVSPGVFTATLTA